jgi:hypothetical protein
MRLSAEEENEITKILDAAAESIRTVIVVLERVGQTARATALRDAIDDISDGYVGFS